MLWDLNDGKHLYTLENSDIINSLCFSPNRYIKFIHTTAENFVSFISEILILWLPNLNM